MRVNGFSLIEVLVVIGVITLVNLILLPNFTSLMSVTKAISAKSTTRNVMVAIEQFYFLNQAYPNTLQISTVLAELKSAEIISELPTNPFTGLAYSDSDASGRLSYRYVSTDEYQLQLYGQNNEQIILTYP
ncbi:MAG: prepilin-type N-terminal cleavage/methylation domain-containing protein [Candidatus Margulisiibacteriota bacterium]